MITFENITLQNFMSVGNSPITIDYTKHKTTLVTAQSGAGKSAIILDSLAFSLFGTGYRNISKSLLINSINQKKCLVILNFSVASDKYKVVRGIKPNVFEIYKNGTLVNMPLAKDYQAYLESVLHMNYRTFTQVVIMGPASYVPFMKLPALGRRNFIEDILDIGTFSTMNKLLKSKIDDNNFNLASITNSVKDLKERITMQNDFIKMIGHERESRILSIEKRIESLMEDAKKLQEKIDSIDKLLPENNDHELATTRKKLADLHAYKEKFDKVITKHESDLKFYQELDFCPTCKQNISEVHKQNIISKSFEKVVTITESYENLNNKISRTVDQLDNIAAAQKNISELTTKKQNFINSITTNMALIVEHQKEIAEWNKKQDSLDTEKAKLKAMATEVIEKSKLEKERLDKKKYYDTLVLMLKDTGIKSKVIKQYIPVFNKLINSYLQEMDLFVNFTLDENFNEVIKSRHRDSFTYESFSAGEQQRIDLSMMFVFREVARLKNVVSTNLLIMDEVLDSHLDANSIDCFFDINKKLAKTNLFVISHREISSDRFEDTIRLTKKNNFTVIEE